MAEDDTNLLDPEEDDDKRSSNPHGESSADSLPELPAPAPHSQENEPARTPISINDLDPEWAKELLEAPIRLGASVFPDVDRSEAEELVSKVIDKIDLRARTGKSEGISIAGLAELADITRSGIDERFDASVPRMANLVARAVNAQAGRRVFYEQFDSHPARAGRRHNGVGTERVPEVPRNQLHMLAYSLGASDRHCPAASDVLSAGTRWDRSNPRYGQSFPRWVAEYEGRMPSSLAEHLERMLGEDRSVRRAFHRAFKEGQAVFDESLTPKRMAAAFSKFLVVPLMPCGTSFVEHRSHGEVLRPGREADVVRAATASGRRAVLACGEASIEERLAFEEDAEALVVGKLPSMYELDIHKQHSVEYRWSPSRHELGRYEAGAGSRLEIWRLIGYDGDESFWRMLSLIERYTQVKWTYGCTLRWELDCMPGMQKAHLPESCAGVRALLTMANAGIADALRRFGRGESR